MAPTPGADNPRPHTAPTHGAVCQSLHSMSKKRKNPEEDWKFEIDGVWPEDWIRAGCAADAIAKRAMEFLAKEDVLADLNADTLFSQHVKAQLAYINAKKHVNLGGNVDIECGINNPLDINLANKNDAFAIVNDGSVTLAGGLEVYVDNLDENAFQVSKQA